MSKLPHFLENWFTDGGKVVSPTRRPPFTLQEDSWYSFLLEAESTPGPKCGWKIKQIETVLYDSNETVCSRIDLEESLASLKMLSRY
jgi:hypothetical protein